MPLVRTDAIVLHAFDYLETSRILRVATRDIGVQSVLARGARRSRSRYGTALDLFASGVAELHTKPGRELHTLASFDVTRSRGQLAADLDRFTAASALAELMLRFGGGEAHDELFAALISALDALAQAGPGVAIDTALAGAWHLVSQLGFGPSIDACASCHASIALVDPLPFSHPAGGVLCPGCTSLTARSRVLPPEARVALRTWLSGQPHVVGSEGERRAHQRLLREFLSEHLTDGRPLRAYEAWERDLWRTLNGAATP